VEQPKNQRVVERKGILNIVVKIGTKIVKSMDFAILISLKDLDFE
jgi:hypothetical protein